MTNAKALDPPYRMPIQERINIVLPTNESPLLVATVQHTGTMFSLKKLYSLEQRPIREWIGDTPLAFAHLNDSEMRAIDDWQGAILTTYRDPIETRQSWLNRKRNLDEYYEQWRNWFLLLQKKPMIVDITHKKCSFELNDWVRENSWHER